jgi:hypothetical protein
MRFTWQVKGMHAAIDERRSPSGEAEAAIESCSADVCRAILHSRGRAGALHVIRRTDQDQMLALPFATASTDSVGSIGGRVTTSNG